MAVDRAEEGRRIVKEHGALIKSLGGRRFEIPSRSKVGRRRFVDLDVGACTCPDNQQRGERCAHIIAADLASSKPAPRKRGGWEPMSPKQKERVLAWLETADTLPTL
jgi:predicted nucleic acid-binding Zn finger protein